MKKVVLNERDKNLQFIENLNRTIDPQKLPDNLLREYTQFLLSISRRQLYSIKPKKSGVKKVLTLIFFIFLTYTQNAQCLVCPTAPSCNPVGSTALVNNDVVAAGQVKTVNSTVSYSTITMSGGTLIVCGALTLNTITFNSGVIIVNPGATVSITPSMATVFGNNSYIYNYGNFTISGSIVTGQNNIISNCSTSSIFTVAFNQLVVQGPNTYVINNGIIICSFFIVQPTNSPNTICSGAGSAIITNFMINQYPNAFISPNGPSCINITQQIINNQPMTATASVQICYIAGNVSIIGSPNFGSATINNNCPNCTVSLPLKLTSFNGFCNEGKITLNWISENEVNTSHFVVEKSHNGIDFIKAGQVPSIHNSSFIHSYNYEFLSDVSVNSVQYVRLKQCDNNTDFSYSPVISVSCNSEGEFEIFPSCNNGNYINVMCSRGLESVTIYDASGRFVKNTACNNEKFNTLVFDNPIANGVYIVIAKNSSGKTFYKKMIVE